MDPDGRDESAGETEDAEVRGVKTGNGYASAMGRFYSKTPKSVFAALAYSYASMFDPGGDCETSDPAEILKRFRAEWKILNENGIISQPAPKEKP